MALTPAELKDWVPVLFERSNAAVALWNFECLVAVGVISFLATAKDSTKTSGLRWLIAACFLLFAMFNGLGIYTNTLAQIALFEGLQPLLSSSAFPGLAGLKITAPWWANAFVHIVIDAAVLIAIWRI